MSEVEVIKGNLGWYVYDHRSERTIGGIAAPSAEAALIEAERRTRTTLDQVQQLLTAERDRLHAERR